MTKIQNIQKLPQINKKTIPNIAVLFIVGASNTVAAVDQIEVNGLAQFGLHYSDHSAPWLSPWLDGGTGVLRENEGLNIGLDFATVELHADINVEWSITSVLQSNLDGNEHFGATEFHLNYRPIPTKGRLKGIRNQLRIGYFYPEFSLENTDIGWTSPYTFNFSAINSWVAEEVRPLGIEWTISRPGRQVRSPHSYEFVAAAYQQNDGVASLLSWRGWAIHNRQSVIGEKVDFANYFQFMPVEHPNPTYVDINKETDGRVGFYLGAHYQYLKRTDFRVYLYDNLANPFGLEPDMQYSWRTKFASLSVLHKLNRDSRVLFQYMNGSTEMGDNLGGVHNDFQAWYLLYNKKLGQHRFTARYDAFDVNDKDLNSFDPNQSKGNSWTLNWRYVPTSGWFGQTWHLGAEVTYVDSNNQNRTLWTNWRGQQDQTKYSLISQLRF